MNHHSPADQKNIPQQNPSATPNSTEALILEKAKKALALAQQYKCAPEPKSFGVWYTYTERSCEIINTRIDEIVEKKLPITPYEVTQIWEESHAARSGIGESNRLACLKLGTEMEAIMQMIQSHLASSEGFSGSLTQTIETLNSEPGPKAIRKSIEMLVAENTKMRSETANLSDHLHQSQTEISQMRESLEISQQNEMKDVLTALPNRRCFDTTLADEVATAHRENQPLCLAMMDIDHFKKLNDDYGHLIGDEVLKFVGKLLNDNVKGKDLAARFGGEEFALILPGTTLAGACKLTEHIRQALAQTKLILTKRQQPIGQITASFGIAKIGEYDDTTELIRRADAKLYEAKREGRNRVVCDDIIS